MKDEIKQILDNLEDAGFMYKRISPEEIKKILDYITNLQERFDALLEAHKIVDELETEYQERNEKAINEVIRVLQIILEQPSEDKLDDLWIINKLEGIQTLLQGGDSSD